MRLFDIPRKLFDELSPENVCSNPEFDDGVRFNSIKGDLPGGGAAEYWEYKDSENPEQPPSESVLLIGYSRGPKLYYWVSVEIHAVVTGRDPSTPGIYTAWDGWELEEFEPTYEFVQTAVQLLRRSKELLSEVV